MKILGQDFQTLEHEQDSWTHTDETEHVNYHILHSIQSCRDAFRTRIQNENRMWRIA